MILSWLELLITWKDIYESNEKTYLLIKCENLKILDNYIWKGQDGAVSLSFTHCYLCIPSLQSLVYEWECYTKLSPRFFPSIYVHYLQFPHALTSSSEIGIDKYCTIWE